MGKNYDNWGRLVGAVMEKEKLRKTALAPSITSSESSDISLLSSSKSTSAFYDQSLSTIQKHIIVGARELTISWRNMAKPRFLEMDDGFPSGRWLDIRGKIKTRLLPPRTSCAAYLIFQLGKRFEGLESVKAMIRFVNRESDREAMKRAQVVHLQPVADIKGEIAVRRVDGLMEVEIGKFYIYQGDDGEVEARLSDSSRLKSGLIVSGIEFRTMNMNSATSIPSKRYTSNRKGRGKQGRTRKRITSGLKAISNLSTQARDKVPFGWAFS